MALTASLTKPAREIGGFFAMSQDVILALRPPVAWRECILQAWFVARVAALPAVALGLVFNALVIFMLDVLFISLGAGDLAGVGASLSVITQIGPFTTAMVISGAAATAMCADLGARTIREELDAMRVMGINPIQRLVVPRVMALTFNALLLAGVVCITGLAGDYLFAVYVQNVTPGPFAATLTLLAGVSDIIVCLLKAALFGLVGGLIACYKGLNPAGGPAGVGNAVNETVVYTIMATAAINTFVTALTTGAV
ncbi:MlaE family ABC transporter permease [uncultured Mycobacterium sp.]|uniref:MlaE family ABC transporter permease n=1 Tax=uncultured Mycobacterium sp. TaxID=171292 RepID=UPI0035CB62C4